MGNVCSDPQIKHTPKGTAVTEISLAVNKIGKDQHGQRTEETTFVDVTFWGRTAETVAQYLGKGSPLFVEGRLKMDTWVDKQTGQNRSKLKVVGDSFQFISGREQGSSPNQNSAAKPAQSAESKSAASQSTNLKDDIPF